MPIAGPGDITIDKNVSPPTITVGDATHTSVDIQDIYDVGRAWEDDIDNMDFPKIWVGDGKQGLGGGNQRPPTLTLQSPWEIRAFPGNGEGAFIRMPGTVGNFVSTDDINLLDADTAHLQQSIGAWSQYNAAVPRSLGSTLTPVFGDSYLVAEVGAGAGEGVVSGSGSAVSPSATVDFCVSVAVESATDITVGLIEYDAVGGSYVTEQALVTQAGTVGSFDTIAGQITVGAGTNAVGIYVKKQAAGAVDVYVDAACVGSQTFTPSLRIVGDLDIRAKIASDDYALGGGSSGYQCIVSTSTDATDGLELGISDTGEFLAYYAGVSGQRTEVSSTASFVNGETYEVKVEWDISAGKLDYYVDGVDIGDDFFTAEAGAGDGSTLSVGAFPSGTSRLFDGDMYWVEVRDGIDGPVIYRMDAADVIAVTDGTTWTGSVDGRTHTANGTGLALNTYAAERIFTFNGGTVISDEEAAGDADPRSPLQPAAYVEYDRTKGQEGLTLYSQEMIDMWTRLFGGILYQDPTGKEVIRNSDNSTYSEANTFSDDGTTAYDGTIGIARRDGHVKP